MKRVYGAMAAAGMVAGLAACSSPETEPKPDEEINIVEAIFDAGTVILPGRTAILTPGDYEDAAPFIREIDFIDKQDSNGFEDEDAPTVGRDPIRVDGHVSMGGDKPKLKNDLACDAINVNLDEFKDPRSVYIGAIALSKDNDDLVLISWPKDGADTGNTLFVCFNNGHEPSAGIALVASDIPR